MALSLPRSRYALASELRDASGFVIVDTPAPMRFRARPDTIVHRALATDTWYGLAARYYSGLHRRPEHLWWVLCDFQPEPVLDPTIPPEPGEFVYIPAPAFVQGEVFALRSRATEEVG